MPTNVWKPVAVPATPVAVEVCRLTVTGLPKPESSSVLAPSPALRFPVSAPPGMKTKVSFTLPPVRLRKAEKASPPTVPEFDPVIVQVVAALAPMRVSLVPDPTNEVMFVTVPLMAFAVADCRLTEIALPYCEKSKVLVGATPVKLPRIAPVGVIVNVSETLPPVRFAMF